jgi:hypothetical protein
MVNIYADKDIMIAACIGTILSIGRLWLTEDEARHVGLLHFAEFRCANDVGKGETRAAN